MSYRVTFRSTDRNGGEHFTTVHHDSWLAVQRRLQVWFGPDSDVTVEWRGSTGRWFVVSTYLAAA